MDQFRQPADPCHVLVIPREHVENIYGVDDALGADLFSAHARIARAVKGAFAPDGITTWSSNGPGAGQEVMHFHLHVFPRRRGVRLEDAVVRQDPEVPVGDDVLASAAAKIRSELTGPGSIAHGSHREKPMDARRLVLINGPIASGKNAVSTALAGLFERQARRVAVIDLDELWFMLDHQTPRSHDVGHWLEARRAAAALTDEFYRSGRDSVIVNGPFFTEEERSAYLDHVRTPVTPLFVTLRVSFGESWRRAQADPRRVLSKRREWLRERYAEAERLLPPLLASDLVIGTDGRGPDQIATDILAAVENGRARSARP